MAQTRPKHISKNLKAVDKQWFVIYCKPNTEKKTAKRLAEIGIKTYCPTQLQIRQWSDRKKKIQVPVLPSMVLVYLYEKDRNKVFQIATVVRYLFWLNQPAIVTQTEIENLEKALTGNYKDISIDKLNPNDAKVKLRGIGLEDQSGHLKYTTKTHHYVYLERLGYVIKIKR